MYSKPTSSLSLPAEGPLFPHLQTVRSGDQATEFRQPCDGLKISGVSLHSYRYAWAERALKCGYPERFAQQALGHNSKAVHHAYSKHAEVTVPSLADWGKDSQGNPPWINWESLPDDYRQQTVPLTCGRSGSICNSWSRAGRCCRSFRRHGKAGSGRR